MDIMLEILRYIPVSSFTSLSKTRFMQCATFIMENSTELNVKLAQGQSFQIKESVNENNYTYRWHFFTHQNSLKRKHHEDLDEEDMHKRVKYNNP